MLLKFLIAARSRDKPINGCTCLSLVENVREDGRTRQRIIRNLGQNDAVLAPGRLERVAASFARRAKPEPRTRPICHSSDAAIRGHVFCAFLAPVLRNEFHHRCRVARRPFSRPPASRSCRTFETTPPQPDHPSRFHSPARVVLTVSASVLSY
jgi:hypothetical protein